MASHAFSVRLEKLCSMSDFDGCARHFALSLRPRSCAGLEGLDPVTLVRLVGRGSWFITMWGPGKKRGICHDGQSQFPQGLPVWELLEGCGSPGKGCLARYDQPIRKKTPQSYRFRGLHALSRYPKGEERCMLQALERWVRRSPSHRSRCEAPPATRRPPRARTSIFQCSMRVCAEAVRWIAIVEKPIARIYMENRGENIMTRTSVGIGEALRSMIAADAQPTSRYR